MGYVLLPSFPPFLSYLDHFSCIRAIDSCRSESQVARPPRCWISGKHIEKWY
jgi:hypothetical protein